MLAFLVALEASQQEYDPSKVSPGAVGFLAIGLLAAMVMVLGFFAVRTLRRMAYREQIREDIAAELAQADAAVSADK
ncbi:MAG: hypothetical protein Q4C71_01315 [Microbacteriaceae bacterium]|nr:hypothetical protein [Microbacteriaceae bacterium]